MSDNGIDGIIEKNLPLFWVLEVFCGPSLH